MGHWWLPQEYFSRALEGEVKWPSLGLSWSIRKQAALHTPLFFPGISRSYHLPELQSPGCCRVEKLVTIIRAQLFLSAESCKASGYCHRCGGVLGSSSLASSKTQRPSDIHGVEGPGRGSSISCLKSRQCVCVCVCVHIYECVYLPVLCVWRWHLYSVPLWRVKICVWAAKFNSSLVYYLRAETVSWINEQLLS